MINSLVVYKERAEIGYTSVCLALVYCKGLHPSCHLTYSGHISRYLVVKGYGP